MSKPRGPFHPISRPGSSFTDQQRKELSVFVSNVGQQVAEEVLKSVEAAMREFYGHLVAHGCLVQSGVDSIAAAQAARHEAEAQVPASNGTGEPPAAIAEPVHIDVTSPIIQ